MRTDFPVLIVSEDAKYRLKMAELVNRCELRPICCRGLNDARALLARERFAAVFCSELLLEGDASEVVTRAGKSSPVVPVVVVSRLADWNGYLKAIRGGAFDYIGMLDTSDAIVGVLMRALNQSRLLGRPAGAYGEAT